MVTAGSAEHIAETTAAADLQGEHVDAERRVVVVEEEEAQRMIRDREQRPPSVWGRRRRRVRS